MLNVDGSASKTCTGILYENSSRSLVIQERMTMRADTCVSKRTSFTYTTSILTQEEDEIKWEINGTGSEVKEVVMECAFAKLCAALGVGVPVGSPDHPFDLVCYEDCIEFFMEKCIPVKDITQMYPLEIEERLKYCVLVMHTFHLIHKDLKPGNILVTQNGKAVLTDYGISTHVKETVGYTSTTYR